MRITDVLKTNTGDVLALCMGNDIDAGFSCSKILANGREYGVLKTDVMMSFSGNMCAMMIMATKEPSDVPRGPFTILQ